MLAGGTLADKPPSPLEPWASSPQVVTLAEPVAAEAIGSKIGKRRTTPPSKVKSDPISSGSTRACNAATPASALLSGVLKDASLSPVVEVRPTSSPMPFFVSRLPSRAYAAWACGWGGESPAHLGAHVVNRPDAKQRWGRTGNNDGAQERGRRRLYLGWVRPLDPLRCSLRDASQKIVVGLGMDSDRVRTNTNSDVTIYRILFWIQIRILSNTNISNSDSHSNTYSIYIRVIMSIKFICWWFNDWSNHVTSRE
jgi:hypothetical protein